MNKIIRKHNLLFVMTIILGIMVSSVNVLLAFIIGQLIDNINTGKMNKLGFFSILILCFVVVYVLLGIFYSYLGNLYSKKILHAIKSKVYSNLSKMPIYEYDEEEFAFYYNMLSHDIDEINGKYIQKRYETVVSVFAFIISLSSLLFIDWMMSLIFIALTMLVIIVPSIIGKYQHHARTAFSEKYEGFIKELENVLSGFEVLKVLNVSKNLFKKINEEDLNMENGRMKSEVIDSSANSLISGISMAVQLLCILIGSYFVINGHITTGGLIMAVQILNSVFYPIQDISANMNLMKSVKTLRDKIERFLIREDSNKKPVEKGDILLENVSLLLGDKKVLNNFGYEFKEGNSYIIVGESGCGKSTLAKLISGFYSNFDGQIKYNGELLENIDTSSISNVIRYISTKTYVINNSLKENIRMYRDYTDEQVIEVARRLGFDDSIIMKDELGHGGKFISSGEYQRIAIARAMIENPYCVILDEPTANLDKENTKKIQDIIKNIEAPIKIVISHDYDEEYLSSFDHVLDMTGVLMD